MSTGVPYIGSRIALISKSQIRYEGILYTIDTNESTVALKDVRSFGSEGRPRPGGGPDIPPSSEIYEYIIFRGPDIADLYVIATPEAAAAPSTEIPAPAHSEASQSVQPPMAHGTSASTGKAPVGNGVHPPAAPVSQPAAQISAPQQPQQLQQPQQSQQSREASQYPQQPQASMSQTRQQAQYQRPHGGYRGAKPWGPPPSAAPATGGKREGAQSYPNGNSAGGRRQGTGGAQAAHVGSDVPNGSSGTPGVGQPNGGGSGGGGRRDGQRRRGRGAMPGGGGRARPAQPGIVVPTEDFDFEAMNQKFQKASLDTPVDKSREGVGAGVAGATVVGLDGDGAGAGQAPPDLAKIEVKYDKSSSFFDMLEPPSRERATAEERAQMRSNDFETFGETYQPQYHYNRRGRGRGGGRGRGRRGGYGNHGYGYGGHGANSGRGGSRPGPPAHNA